MNRKIVLSSVSLVLLALAAGSGAFFAVRAIKGGPEGTTAQPGSVATYPPQEVFEADAAKPRFSGEIEGIYLAANEEAVPPDYETVREKCAGEGEKGLPWDAAGVLNLDVKLPPEYVFNAGSLNTGVIGCRGMTTAARWDYEITSSNNYPTSVTIARGFIKYNFTDASVDRVHSTVIGGRKAILIEPITPDGLGSNCKVIFPEEWGQTEISSGGLPLSNLLEVANAVAEATR